MLESEMPSVPQETAWWALANERRHWTPGEIESFQKSIGNLTKALWGSRGQQVRLGESKQVLAGLAGGAIAGLLAGRAKQSPAEDEQVGAIFALMAMALSGILLWPLTNPDFPRRLRNISNPPLMLYAIGSQFSFDRCVGVSGTRTPSRWGQKSAERLGRRLAGHGWLVTSGLARGIDSGAHRGALLEAKGRTVAVSALPLNRIYPPENSGLAKQISQRGALLSEHGLSEGAGKIEFLRRNRIISGLSFVQFIVETNGTGGTRQQAETALAQGRPVFALRPPPGERKSREGYEVLRSMGVETATSVEDAVRLTDEAWDTATT